MVRKLILDVDTGTDDAVAIMFAASHPDLDLIGVTTVSGNTSLEHTTDNTLRVLDFIDRSDIAVHPGSDRPIARRDAGAYGNELPIPAPHSKASDVGAVEYLVETFRSTAEEITLVPVAPLSNIAAALAVEPGLVEAVPEVVVMGGAHHVGSVTASAEFNIWADPEAAATVFAAGFRNITLIPLDATYQALVTRDDCNRFAAFDTPAGVAAARFIGCRIDDSRGRHPTADSDAAPVHDALCTAYLVDPEVITTRHAHVAVETNGELTLGRTVIDLRTDVGDPPNCHVAFGANAPRFVELLAEAFRRRSGATPSSFRGRW